MLKIQVHNDRDITTVTLDGVIDAYSCGQFEESFSQLIELGNYKIIVDLSNVDYMTAVGAGIFMALQKITEDNKGDIVLVHPKPAVREIFGLIGLDKMVTVMDSKDTALGRFRTAPENHQVDSDRTSSVC